MTEGDLQKQIVDTARQMGWWVKVTSAGKRVRRRGIPDLYLTHPGKGVVWIEVKPPDGGWDVTPGQAEFIRETRRAGGQAWIVDNLDAALEVLK